MSAAFIVIQMEQPKTVSMLGYEIGQQTLLLAALVVVAMLALWWWRSPSKVTKKKKKKAAAVDSDDEDSDAGEDIPSEKKKIAEEVKQLVDEFHA